MDRRRWWVAALALLPILASCGGGATLPAASVPVFALRRDAAIGHCLVGADGVYRQVECVFDHNLEITGTVDYPAAMVYPDGLPMRFFTDCDAGFTDYVGVAPDREAGVPGQLRSVPVIPSEDAWSLGDTRVVCTARADRAWAGSVQGLGVLEPPPASGRSAPDDVDCLC